MNLKVMLVLLLLPLPVISSKGERNLDKHYSDRTKKPEQKWTESDRYNSERDIKKIRKEALIEKDKIKYKEHDIGDPCKINPNLPVCEEEPDR